MATPLVIGTERADWDQQIFRNDLWLYHDDVRVPEIAEKNASLIQLTQSGHDTEPKWSPDSRWIAFLSERKASSEKSDGSDSDSDGDQSTRTGPKTKMEKPARST